MKSGQGIGVLFWDYSWVEPTYKEMNENLKKQVLRNSLKQAMEASLRQSSINLC